VQPFKDHFLTIWKASRMHYTGNRKLRLWVWRICDFDEHFVQENVFASCVL